MTPGDVLARLEWIAEAIGDGDVVTAVVVLLDLIDDLQAASHPERRAA